MPSINSEFGVIITSKSCFLVAVTAANEEPTFTITYTELYLSVGTLSAQDNGKLLKKLELDFKSTINWNKYQSNITEQVQE